MIDLVECPGRETQPCHNTDFRPVMLLLTDGVVYRTKYVCTQCGVALEWDGHVWRSVES